MSIDMRILIVSDSHGKNGNIKEIVNRIKQIDLFIHLGDSQCSNNELETIVPCPIEIVAGNTDWHSTNPKSKIIELMGLRIFITHGHNHHVKHGSFDDIIKTARTNNAHIAMFGHTHVPFLDQSKSDIILLNPGSITYPRQQGYLPSYMIMEIDSEGIPHFMEAYI